MALISATLEYNRNADLRKISREVNKALPQFIEGKFGSEEVAMKKLAHIIHIIDVQLMLGYHEGLWNTDLLEGFIEE